VTAWDSPPRARRSIGSARCAGTRALTHQLLRWSSAIDRARVVGNNLGGFCRHAGDRHRTRPAAGGVPGLPTQPRERRDHGRETAFGDTIATIQSQVQTFYTFLFDHSADAALATGDRRFTEITETHTRLWSPIHPVRTPRNQRELTWHSTADLQRMLAYLDVLGADPAERVTVTHVDGRLSVVAGLVDPQAARAWLLQALTGRRASEIEMRSFRRLLRRP
jgi:hypothetical protein